MRARALVVVAAALVAFAPGVVRADDAPTKDTAPRIVLARFSTTYANDAEHKARASNVELGAEAINGKVIAAGATFSFNDAVGERTAAFGYAKSIVLRDGMIAEGVGGGACQVASTLHAAALLGGLEVVARAPHSRPSAYIRMGLDATVALGAAAPAIDLKLKNPTLTPLTIRARAARGTLEVWLDGPGATRLDVTLTSEILERTAFSRVVERDKRAKEDTVRVKAFGIPGYRVKRTREVRAADGTVKRDVRIDVYPPTNEIVQVAPSLDESRIRVRAASTTADAEAETSPDEPSSRAPVVVVDPAAARPLLVQLRPSTRVELDNSAK
jgi:vancomycin resistance protein YoaR